LEDIAISGAKGVLMNITSNSDLTMEEMTEASDRIYNEVGEDADIIWGTAVDDSIGNEMRVTVIATGIDSGPDTSIKNELRGKVRDITLDDINDAVDYDEPTFIRRKHAVGESSGSTYRGYRGIVVDNADLANLDVPTFLRRKAD
jgi:cell division protein FtsZ